MTSKCVSTFLTLLILSLKLNWSPSSSCSRQCFGNETQSILSYDNTVIKTFAASSGPQQVSIDNALLGPFPERILIALVKNTTFVGSASTNPFHFLHYNITINLLHVNGVHHPPEPLTMNCSSPFGAMKQLLLLYITMTMFRWIPYKYSPHYILGFDLTPDREADEEHIGLPRQGNVRIEARFKNRYQNPSLLFCMLNCLDTSKSKNLEWRQ